MKKVLLEMKNITKSYGEGNSIFYALKDASLQIVDGDYVAIMGPSGSGKSTLLHMMGLLDEPTKGEIYVDGKHVTSMTEKERANVRNKKIGFVFQTFNLIQTLTALENVELPRIIHGAPKEERIKKAQQTLERLGMGHKFNNQPNAMSGGERQRTAIARALVNDLWWLTIRKPRRFFWVNSFARASEAEVFPMMTTR